MLIIVMEVSSDVRFEGSAEEAMTRVGMRITNKN
jgi:hypothetical protein